jgi:hypothetical protein
MLKRRHGHPLQVTPGISSISTAEFKRWNKTSGIRGPVDDKLAEAEIKISLRRKLPFGKLA